MFFMIDFFVPPRWIVNLTYFFFFSLLCKQVEVNWKSIIKSSKTWYSIIHLFLSSGSPITCLVQLIIFVLFFHVILKILCCTFSTLWHKIRQAIIRARMFLIMIAGTSILTTALGWPSRWQWIILQIAQTQRWRNFEVSATLMENEEAKNFLYLKYHTKMYLINGIGDCRVCNIFH